LLPEHDSAARQDLSAPAAPEKIRAAGRDMKIAITSCINAYHYPDQPVWNNIASQNPDVLVLLGDSIYFDSPPVRLPDGSTEHPSNVMPEEFLAHGLMLYNRLFKQAGFSALISQVKKTYAIWDDHDFLWNGSAGGGMPNAIYGGHIRATRALFRNYRETLAKRAPTEFPANTTDPRLSQSYEKAPGYQAIDLDDKVCLHLTDGRSFRDKHNLLGSDQRGQIAEEMQNRPGRIHLLASGIVMASDKGERWSGFSDDYQWLLTMGKTHKIIVLSGDVHQNRLPEPVPTQGNKLYEITASGAGISKVIAPGPQMHNFGIVEIGGELIELTTYEGNPAGVHKTRAIPMPTW
jgi:hypothetical protein